MRILKKGKLQSLRTSSPLKFLSLKGISFNKSAEALLYMNSKHKLANIVQSVLCTNETAELFILNY